MASNDSQLGKIITFYSYKGGTGRSMALANIACLLAKAEARPKVLVIDWDLEAPGLHRYFAAKSEKLKDTKQIGLINYFWSLHKILDSSHSTQGKIMPRHEGEIDDILPIDRFVIRDVVPGVDMITAGKFDSEYSRLVNSFDWVKFHEQYGFAISALRDSISRRYDYCLIDSRTGVTDTSGICTTLLPEKLVGVFTPNKQSLYGLLDLLEHAVEYRRSSNDFRSLSIFPLPSRIDKLGERSTKPPSKPSLKNHMG
jgi:cellulose biosynthesis protein BcsQ